MICGNRRTCANIGGLRAVALVIAAFLMSFPSAAMAGDRWPSATVDGPMSKLWLWPEFEYLADVSLEASADDVAAIADEQWKTLPSRHHHLGNRKTAAWARFSITNATDELRWFLVHEQTFVDSVELYQQVAGGRWQKVTGLREGLQGWFGGSRNPAFEIVLAKAQTERFLLRTQTLSLQRFPLSLVSQQEFQRSERLSYMVSGIVLAIPLAVAVFIVLLWWARRQLNLLIVTALVLSEMIGAAWVGGVLYSVAPWLTPKVLGYIGVASWVTTIILAYLHARTFLYLDEDAPRLARVFKIAPWTLGVFLLLEFAGSPWGRNLTIYTAFGTLVLFLVASVWQALRGRPFAWLYAMAWGTYLLSVSLVVINLLGSIPPNLSNLLMFGQGSVVSLLFALAVVGHLRDADQRVQAELNRSNQRFMQAAQGASVGLFDWDLRQSSLFLSPAAKLLLNVDGDVLTPDDVVGALAGEPLNKLGATVEKAKAEKSRTLFADIEIGEKPLHISGSLVWEGSSLLSMSGSVADVSEIQELERSHAKNLALEEFRKLFDNAPVGLYRASSKGDLLRANPALLELLDASSESELRQTMGDALWHTEKNSFERLRDRLGKYGSVKSFEYSARIGNKLKTITLSENARITQRVDNEEFVYEGALHDISARTRLEHELRAASARVEKAMADRTRLFAATNHDLRQPLQSLGLFIELLRGRATDKQILKWSDQMRSAHLSLSDTLDGLLALSKLESGSMEPRMQMVRLQVLFDALTAEYSEMAAAKGITIVAVSTGRVVWSDPRLLERILRNLISNAVRYTHEGRILLGCRKRFDRIAVQVWDTGEGIAAQDQLTIFEEFQQADAGRRTATGIGLGLAIVSGLSELIDADIGVKSIVGKGSCFEIVLPVAVQASVLSENPERDSDLAGLDGISILIVEDERTVREALKEFLIARGAGVFAAANITEAEAAFAKSDGVDLLLLDYRLANGEVGLECLARLRALSGREIPALLLTGESVDSKRAENLLILRKPVEPRELVDAINHIIGNS